MTKKLFPLKKLTLMRERTMAVEYLIVNIHGLGDPPKRLATYLINPNRSGDGMNREGSAL